MSKVELRRSAREARRALAFQTVLALSEEIERKLESLNEFKQSKVIATYVSMIDEVQTERIIGTTLNSHKRVLVPIVDSRNKKLIFSEIYDISELAVGHFHIREPRPEFVRPVDLSEAEVIVVPIVAWDERGFRIGNGGGYFDKALAPLKGNLTVGLAFEAQKVNRVPEENFDIPLKMIITERRILRFKKN
ncbi:MAG: 5-formyltetrahydrofolate cyclo-ligase [Nitrososphaerota archaeon]|nr:5-formyltetrahydrofolate cyclo-ligase [Nitrososphaerota archaeon]